ncbi:MAG TPA: hypothetical protein VF407_03000, partial [Polyangiaceae bacterium]
MNGPVARFVARLVAIELAVWFFVDLIVLAFAPRLLLLSASAIVRSSSVVTWVFSASGAIATVTTFLL